MFEQYSVAALKQLLRECKDHHDIKYSKLRRHELMLEMEKRFLIHDGILYCRNGTHAPPNNPQIKGGNAKTAGYVRRMEAENKIDFPKIHNPSKYMIDKYGNKQTEDALPEFYFEPVHHHHEPAPHDAHIFAENERLDFHVAKPKKKSTKSTHPTEAQEDREREAREKELERKKKLLDELELLKKQVVECKKKLGKEDSEYQKARDELRGKRWKGKEKLEEELGHRWRANRKKITDKYPAVYQYLESNKLKDDLNDVYKHINLQIRKL